MFSGLLYHELESAKLRVWGACMLTYLVTDCLLMWSRAWCAYVLVCLRACVLNVLECLACLACLACFSAHVFGGVTCFMSLSTC